MIPWDQIHGATTHFPVALLLFSTGCDLCAVAFWKIAFTRELRLASFYSLAIAAVISFGAVLSGVMITKGDVWGQGTLGWHHRFVWPAFALIVGLAIWRLLVRERSSRVGLSCYLALMLIASGAIAAAGYWGGELILGGG